ncbi:hypothetical protein HBN50_16550 [Halobacteriovorax sp. GB3]|uniref:hypothetical protein n=1 Tax=Halobacteriovorax sp. GB3 TaxID=2719615 RepID=UPI00235EE53E|nr:hypothetical protein [Halobacteriovorax sp. GB3]MDD0854721.1 hypothetical protein [Halobacteriovorax sp. GB3]
MLSKLKQKINLKRFFLLSIISTCICLALAKNLQEVLAILGVYVATLAYLILFNVAVAELFRPYTDKDFDKKKGNKGKVLGLFLGKLLVLIIALLIGVQIMGNRIIIPVINYIIQIIILGLSFKKGN